MKKLMLMLLAGSLLIFNSCTKTTTPGPQGPQGPQGPAGYDGNANVIGSDPFQVTSWALSTADNAYFASFTDADITSAVADRGIVEVFLLYPGDNTWRNLPDIIGNTQFYYRFSQGGFEIYYAKVDGTAPTFPTGAWTFRVVVISPSNRAAHPNTNWHNYNEAMAALSTSAPAAAQ